MSEQTVKVIPQHIVEACARAAHEANRAYCIAIGDNTQPGWLGAPEWQRDSARAGARAVLERNLTPEQQHELWLQHKIATGWRYGLEKNPADKTHPCMVRYDELPPHQRVKDTIFGTVVRTVAAALEGVSA